MTRVDVTRVDVSRCAFSNSSMTSFSFNYGVRSDFRWAPMFLELRENLNVS